MGASIARRAGDISFAAVAAFLFGVFAANMGWNIFWPVIAGFFLAVIVRLFGIFPAWKYAALIFVAVAAGISYYYIYVYWQTSHIDVPAGRQAAFFGIVTEEPKAAGNFTMFAVNLLHPYAGTMDIFIPPNNAAVHYGDEVWINGAVSKSDGAGESPAMFLPRLRVVAEHEGFWLKEVVINFKDAVVRKIAELLPADQAALLAGIVVGTTSMMSPTLKAQMEASGTTYIVNMYGYKIAIVTFAFAAVLKDHIPRRWLLWITLCAIALFVVVSDGTTSALRAAIMGSFAVIARGTGRVASARNAVAFAALGMVLADATLLTDAGFQLSFLSFLGIYYLGPPISNYFHWTDGGALQWKEHAMLSLSTNLAILPIVMNTFGEFSLTSLISNILVMIPWLAVISFGALVVALGFISAAIAFPAIQIVNVLLRYELLVIRVFAAITISMPPVFGSSAAIALYYGALMLFAYYYAAPSQKDH